MAIYKRGGVYWYEFTFKGRRIRESAHTGNANDARTVEAAARRKAALGEAGIEPPPLAPTLRAFSVDFMKQIENECASKPKTVDFYREKLARLLEGRLADLQLDKIDENAVEAYKRDRRAARCGGGSGRSRRHPSIGSWRRSGARPRRPGPHLGML